MEYLVNIVIALIAGAMGSVVGPFISAKLEDRKETKSHKRERIKIWRANIAGRNFNGERDFRDTSTYSEIRPYLSKSTIDTLEGRAITIRDGRGGNLEKTALLDDLAELEKKWKLLD